MTPLRQRMLDALEELVSDAKLALEEFVAVAKEMKAAGQLPDRSAWAPVAAPKPAATDITAVNRPWSRSSLMGASPGQPRAAAGPATAVPISTGLAVALNVLPAESFASR